VSVAQAQQFPCIWCGETLVFILGRGWCHGEDGAAYVKRCKLCKWKGSVHPEPQKCPQCGCLGIVDDHISAPDRT
jgi:hypothetical protein